MRNSIGNIKKKGQSLVEFALVLPILLLLIFGLVEFGRLIFTYIAVNTAAREAARYGSAVGEAGGGLRYYDCTGIVNAGLALSVFTGIAQEDFTIFYDNGPGSAMLYGDEDNDGFGGGTDDNWQRN